jgi:hypothetical protein
VLLISRRDSVHLKSFVPIADIQPALALFLTRLTMIGSSFSQLLGHTGSVGFAVAPFALATQRVPAKEQRLALAIGNSTDAQAALKNPAKDPCGIFRGMNGFATVVRPTP